GFCRCGYRADRPWQRRLPPTRMDRRGDDGLRLSLFCRPRRAGAPPLAIALCAAQRLPQAPLPSAPPAPRGGGQGALRVVRLSLRAAIANLKTTATRAA